jgi:hypothetical protein
MPTSGSGNASVRPIYKPIPTRHAAAPQPLPEKSSP